MAETTKNWPIAKAPKLTRLFGDPKQKIESATHIIEFPGGSVEVARCDDGSYWCHLEVNHGFGAGDSDGTTSAQGEVIGSRVDYLAPLPGVVEIPHETQVCQVALRIMPRKVR